jgi:hypothetical protein
MITDVEPPWRRSKSDNVYCRLNNIPNEIRSNLKVEDNYVTIIGEYSYKVRAFSDNVLVFRERTDNENDQNMRAKRIPKYSDKMADAGRGK